MNLTKEEIKHDLKRNISSILSGTTMIMNKIPKIDIYIQETIEEIEKQCEQTFKLLDIFTESKDEKKKKPKEV